MTLNDPLANVMSHILNSESKGKKECLISPSSKMVLRILSILKENQYIGDFEKVSSLRGGVIKINLIGNINKCGVIKPRFSFTRDNYEMFEKRYLPAKGFGLFIVTTSKGIMSHKEALEKNVGGKFLVYCY